MDRKRRNKELYKCIMTNTSATWQQAAHNAYKLSPRARHANYLNGKKWRIFWKNDEENGALADFFLQE